MKISSADQVQHVSGWVQWDLVMDEEKSLCLSPLYAAQLSPVIMFMLIQLWASPSSLGWEDDMQQQQGGEKAGWKYFGSLIRGQHLTVVWLDYVAFIRILPTQISWWFCEVVSLNQNLNPHCQIQSFTQMLCFTLMCFKWEKDWTYTQELRPGPSQPNIKIRVFLCTIIYKYWEGIPVCTTT